MLWMLLALALPNLAWGQEEVPGMTLEQAVALADRQSAGVRAAEAGTAQAQALRDQVAAARLPSLDLGADVEVWNGNYEIAFAPGSPPIVLRDQVTANLSARILAPLTGQLALGHQVSAADAGVEAATSGSQAARADARYQAADAWLLALETERSLEIVQSQADSLKARVDAAQVAFDAGAASRNDLLLAELAQANVQQAVLMGTAQRDAARARLGLAVGNGGDPVRPLGTVETPPRSPPPVDQLLALAAASRPDLAALDAQLRSSDERIHATSQARLPQVAAMAAYMHTEGQGSFAQADSGYVGAALDWPVWSWGAKTDALDASRAERQRLQAQRDGMLAGLRVEVRTRAQLLLTTAAAYELATTSVAQAEESLHLQDTRHQAGAGTMTELLDAETAVVRARSSQATALYDADRAEVALVRAVGADPWASSQPEKP